MNRIDDIEMLNSFLRDTYDIIQSVSAEGKFLLTNPSWHQVLGYSKEDLESVHLFDLIHPDSTLHCMQVFQGVLVDQQRISNFQAKFITKEGEVVELEGTATPYIVDHKVISTFATLRDVTQQNRTQRELLAQNEKLKQISWLQSHQVRGPLASLMGLLKLLEMDQGVDTSDVLNKLRQCGKDLDNAISQIVESTY